MTWDKYVCPFLTVHLRVVHEDLCLCSVIDNPNILIMQNEVKRSPSSFPRNVTNLLLEFRTGRSISAGNKENLVYIRKKE